MTTANCHQYFQDGKAKRISRPLKSGRYKIEQCLNDLKRFREEVSAIRNLVSGKAGAAWLSACVSSDKHTWLKKLPLHVAFCMGHDLLPALKALKHEGALSVDGEYPGFEWECLTLVDRLEQVRSTLKKGIRVEYLHMRQGGSLLEPLVNEAIELTERALGVR